MTAHLSERSLLVGATAANPGAAVTIWNTMRQWFTAHDLPMEYALYSSYDALCGALLRGEVDIAWNAPMAHAQSLLVSAGACQTLAMRDTDKDVATVIVARPDAGIDGFEDLRGRRVAVGIETSTELRLIPLHQLRQVGLDLQAECDLIDLEPREYPGGGRWVDDSLILNAVLDGAADAGTIFEPRLERLLDRAGLGAGEMKVVWRSAPFCHCAFTARPGLLSSVRDRFVDVLLGMDAADPRIAEMMRLEHLQRWVRADERGWQSTMAAITEAGLQGATFN
jgi:ABC-type phosphate/phosphonate transport system substrate-binding protein